MTPTAANSKTPPSLAAVTYIEVTNPRVRNPPQKVPLRFFYVRSPHVSVRRSRAAGQPAEAKDKEVSEHDKQSAGRGEGVDSSFDMQNGLAGNLLTGSHKPVLRGHSPPPPPASSLQG